MAEAAGSNPVRGFGMPLAFLFNCYTLHSRSIAGIDMSYLTSSPEQKFDEFVSKLVAAADKHISDAEYNRRTNGIQVAACEQISRAGKAYLANNNLADNFLSLLAATGPLSGLV